MNNNNEIKTTALVLSVANYRDFDRMLTLLTPEKGKISAIARGARKTTARALASTDIFCVSDMNIASKGDRHTVTQAILKNSFYHVREDIFALAAAGVIVSATNDVAVLGEQKTLFSLAVNCLNALDLGQEIEPVIAFFVIKLFAVLGRSPNLTRCACCGEESVDGIDFSAFGAVCARCVADVRVNVDSLRSMQTTKNIDISRIKTDKKTAKAMGDWLYYELGHEYKASGTLKRYLT